jgi:hypothetical protein
MNTAARDFVRSSTETSVLRTIRLYREVPEMGYAGRDLRRGQKAGSASTQ